MKKLVRASLLGTSLCWAAAAQAQLIGPSQPYLSFSDSPFASMTFVSGTFYLEDVEDGAINTTGLSVTGPQLCIAGTNCFVGSGLIDSVGNGGNGNLGHSIWANGNQGVITITFNQNALGFLPTAAGLVWTDGVNPITFQAFDQNGVLLGTITGNNADGVFTGTTADDAFYGATNAGGISMLTITDPSGIEIDQIQYGLLAQIIGAVPEPGTWAMMLLGFGAMGWRLRRIRRRRALRLA